MGIQPTDTATGFSLIDKGIIQTLLYFGVFRYPLRIEEILDNLRCACEGIDELDKSLQRLVQEGFVQSRDGFFWVEGEGEIERRITGNKLAAEKLNIAFKRSAFIAKFPFVRSVMISGSLSKGYMEPSSDIDYFIVTEPGRLWVARTLLILYKKLFLLNSHEEFCVNYFVDADHLEIEDKNVFTATETVFLLPTVNPDIYGAFKAANGWSKKYYPNFRSRLTPQCIPYQAAGFGGWLERRLSGKLGERFDQWCMKMTLKRWQKKFGGLDKTRFELALRSRKYVSKHHPSDFQNRVLTRLGDLQQSFEFRFGEKLS